ncbi:hypothetical protein ACWGF3_39620 [Streptomyces xanthophaeus]|uniref:NlpC/P60 domain-containing protein n=1 Tax=Streptomyces xanthophaeus TaxID=67385 RepID=A0A919LGN8_9ACTN|nr:hypothetical protein [Streptomyces xanthophaeus]GHI90276.1 hypothetical protein Sxan_76400 [Streptomyces xanthophaeus]
MKEPLIRRPKVVAALAGLVMAVGLTVMPAQADSVDRYAKPVSTGTIGNGAAPGGPVTREQVIARAKHWVDKRVSYSQGRWWKDEATGGSYRQDCSGFVSMAWQLKESLTTQSLPAVADRLSGFDQLEAGDALDYPAAHAVLFGGWTDKAKGDFVYYSESRSGRPARKDTANIHDSRIAGHPRSAYVPLRYKKLITATSTPRALALVPATSTAPAKPARATTAVPSSKATAAVSAPASGSKASAGSAAAVRPVGVPAAGRCAPGVRGSFWQWIFTF